MCTKYVLGGIEMLLKKVLEFQEKRYFISMKGSNPKISAIPSKYKIPNGNDNDFAKFCPNTSAIVEIFRCDLIFTLIPGFLFPQLFFFFVQVIKIRKFRDSFNIQKKNGIKGQFADHRIKILKGNKIQRIIPIKWYLIGIKKLTLKRVLLLAAVLAGFGCSNDDSSIAPPPDPEIADFLVIGRDLENVYQYSFNGDSETGQLTDLTREIGVFPNYLTLRQEDDLLSFYSFADGAISLTLLDVSTRASAVYPAVFVDNPDQSIAWGINTTSQVFFGFFGPFGTRNLAIQDAQLSGANIQDYQVDVDVASTFQPLLFNNKLYVSYRDNQGDHKLTFYDIGSNTIGSIVNFNSVPISILFDNSGDLAVIKNGSNPVLELYDPNTLELVDEQLMDFNTGFSSGPLDGAVLKDNKLFYAVSYVQPARFGSGPAIFDLTTQENKIIDFFTIADAVEMEIGASISITTQVFDETQNTFLIGYSVVDNDVPGGGILQISVEGDLMANVPLSFFPSYIFRN